MFVEKIIKLLMAFVLLSAVAVAQINIIPKPQQILQGKGSFKLNKQTRFYCPVSMSNVKKVTSFFSELSGLQLQATKTKPTANYIALAFDKSITDNEGYKLSVQPDKIEIKAKTEKGMFWAMQSLRQLMPASVETKSANMFSIPVVEIADTPLTQWRGSMLDCSRHFMPVSVIKKYIDMMSLYKLNTLHWHLTDDQGWRIEIKKHPELTKMGAWRTEADGTKHGGFYTQEQIRLIVAYAAKRNITIVPEIEMPGHAMAALATYPNLSCTGGPFKVPTSFGVFHDVYCAGNEQTFAFIEDVLNEVMTLFPSKYIHIGGDECPKDRWKSCAKCQAKMKAEGLKDEHELQSYFIKRIQKFLTTKGKNLTGWDEIMEGGLAKGATLQVWRDMAFGKQAAEAGNYVISSPTSHCYFDGGQAGLSTEKVYGFNPIPMDIDENLRKYFLGGEANIWTEYIPDYKLEAMAFPRLLAFSEALWTKEKNFEDFHQRLKMQYPRLDILKVQYGPEDKDIFKSTIKFNQENASWSILTQTGMPNIKIAYTRGEGRPTSNDTEVKDSVILKEPGKYQFGIFKNSKQFAQTVDINIAENLALAKPITLLKAQNPNYNATGKYALVDGLIGSTNFRDGIWQGWGGNDLDAAIDLGKPTPIKSICINFFQAHGAWIVLPKSVSFLVSEDGTNWKELKTFDNPTLKAENENKIKPFALVLPQFKTIRYVRVMAKNQNLPDWHPSKGEPAWIFADEIVVK